MTIINQDSDRTKPPLDSSPVEGNEGLALTADKIDLADKYEDEAGWNIEPTSG